jgi:glycosyltransferase involved in cell wall biosynthesis
MGNNRTISVAIITFNEEDRLPACLAMLGFADEVVVVDSGSSDRTAEIATKSGAKVFNKVWQGFGAQKQFAIDQCGSEWVLIVDADERLPPETAAEIEKIVHSSSNTAYSLPRKNYFLGRWIRHAGWWPDRTVRLFKRGTAHMPPKLVHESLVVTGSVGELVNPIIHYPFRNLAHMMKKMDTYSSAGAAELYQSGKKSSYGKAFFRAAWAFFYNYLIRRGILDGGPGLVIAVSDAVNKFFKYVKLKAMHNSDQEQG